MGRKRRKHPLVEGVKIIDVASEGKSLAKVDDKVLFVAHAVPGDIVDVQITKSRKQYMEGRVVSFQKLSDDRVDAFCEHFGVCGGCKWQYLPYDKQLYFKHKQVKDNLERIGKIELPEINPILASAETTFYRNKLEFTFSNKRWMTEEEIATDEKIENPKALGFHLPGRFDKILNINKCWLQAEPSNEIRNFVYRYALDNNLSFHDMRQHEGLLRNIIIRTASTGDLMVIVSFFENDKEAISALLSAIKEKFPQITSLQYVINSKLNDTINDLEIKCFHGNDYIMEEMEGLRFKVGAKSFYQTNSKQAYELYQITRKFAGLTGNELVYDLYTGTGTIAQFVSKDAKRVIGIEYVEDAIVDAKANAELNDIKNVEFYAGVMEKLLTPEFIDEHGKPDLIISDPPRNGMHANVVDTILAVSPKRIVYVSCNPATQARDLQALDAKYEVVNIQPVDMFPHTHHVENVVLLELRK
ncbi:MAG: 23S rRNA (uracil(1939)-C(5))-methyltransferase RlmD [Bacteroidales bacterium]